MSTDPDASTTENERVPNLPDILELAGAIAVLNEAIKTLNRSLFGEKSAGPEDGFGQIGEHVAFLCSEVERRMKALAKRTESENG